MNEDGKFPLKAVIEWWVFNKLPAKWEMITKVFNSLPVVTRNKLLGQQFREQQAGDGVEDPEIKESEAELKKQKLKQQIMESQWKLDEKKGLLIPREHVEIFLEVLAADLRNLGELARKHYGNDAQDLVTETLETVEAKIEGDEFLGRGELSTGIPGDGPEPVSELLEEK